MSLAGTGKETLQYKWAFLRGAIARFLMVILLCRMPTRLSHPSGGRARIHSGISILHTTIAEGFKSSMGKDKSRCKQQQQEEQQEEEEKEEEVVVVVMVMVEAKTVSPKSA